MPYYISFTVLIISVLALYVATTKLNYTILEGLTILLVTIEFLSLLFWITLIIGYTIRPLEVLAVLSTSIWGSIQWATPILLLLILYSWILNPLIQKYIDLLRRYAPRVYYMIFRLRKSIDSPISISFNEKILLFLGLILSIILYTIPYLPTINPRGVPVNVDWIYYYRWLNNMDKEGFMWAFYERSDRFLYLWILYGLKQLLHIDNYVLAVYHNIALSLILTLSVWYFVKELYGSRIAGLAALLTPLSHQSLGFFYGGFQANHFTLSLMYVAMGLLVKPSPTRIIMSTIILALTPFMHPWTWIHMVSAIVIYILYTWIKHRKVSSSHKIVIAAIIVIALTRQLIGGWVLQPLRVIEPSPQRIQGTLPLVKGLLHGFSYYLWGVLNIPLLYIYVVLALYAFNKSMDLLRSIYVASSIILPIAGTVPLIRLAINTPFEIDAVNVMSRRKCLLVLLIVVLLSNGLRMCVNSIGA